MMLCPYNKVKLVTAGIAAVSAAFCDHGSRRMEIFLLCFLYYVLILDIGQASWNLAWAPQIVTKIMRIQNTNKRTHITDGGISTIQIVSLHR